LRNACFTAEPGSPWIKSAKLFLQLEIKEAMMAELKTKPTDADVLAFLQSLESEKKREDALALLQLMAEVTGEAPKLWGPSMIGFGQYHYKYASGHEGDSFLTGFSPRKQNFSLYITAGFARFESLLEQLGKYKTAKSCLYINKLADVDTAILRQLVTESVAYMRATYPNATHGQAAGDGS